MLNRCNVRTYSLSVWDLPVGHTGEVYAKLVRAHVRLIAFFFWLLNSRESRKSSAPPSVMWCYGAR